MEKKAKKTADRPKKISKSAEVKTAKIIEHEAKPVVSSDIRKPSVQTAKKLPYIYAVGKRKSASARVRLYPHQSGEISVNSKKHSEYFPYFEFNELIEQPLKKLDLLGKYLITAKVAGGGKRSQAEAVRHGVARALLKLDESLKKTLRGEGYLTRDPRKKERKKPGLKRARRAPQFSKR